MSRNIDFSKPLTADEVQYVNDRPWLRVDAELSGFEITTEDDAFELAETSTEPDPNLAMVQDLQVPEGAGADTEEDDEEDLPDDYNEWTNDQLKAELKARELPVSGSKEQLVARLTESDDEDEEEDDA